MECVSVFVCVCVAMRCDGCVSVAERSKAPDSSACTSTSWAFWSSYEGVGSDPTADMTFCWHTHRRVHTRTCRGPVLTPLMGVQWGTGGVVKR